jgi:predicted metal-dependent enzyme (double-stranded beta helix superfamily)
MNNPTIDNDFPGKQTLLQRLRGAVTGSDAQQISDRVRIVLSDMLTRSSITLPDHYWQAAADGYKRRMLHHEPDAFCLMAMTWGPGQGTTIHDHCGMWCVEGVLTGSIEVVQYELADQSSGRYKFDRCGTMLTGPGSAGSLIPPHEYHTIRNPDTASVAISIHVYSGEMTRCNVFKASKDGWYEREQRTLSCDR